jgi:ribose transport system ATP-binding protein
MGEAEDARAEVERANRHGSSVALEVADASKAFGPTRALVDVSLTVHAGSIHALLGGNGSGKSTLIKALAGVQRADRGVVRISGREFSLPDLRAAVAHEAGLRFVHQQGTTFDDLSVAENLALGGAYSTTVAGRIRWSELRRRAQAAIDDYEIRARPDDLMGALGPATHKMVEIARALLDVEDAERAVLVLDEPTAALPTAEAHTLLEAIRRYAAQGHAIVYVTHRLDEVFQIADSATMLRDGRRAGTVAVDQTTPGELIELMLGEELAADDRGRRAAVGDPLLELDGFSAGSLEPLALTVRSGEVLGVAGLIGSGRTSLLKGLFGVIPSAGSVRLDGALAQITTVGEAMSHGVAYVPENRPADALLPAMSVRENLSISVTRDYWRHGLIRRRAEQRDTQRLIDDFLIKAQGYDAPIGSLSGGNQQKVVLARWLRRRPRLLLLDEPTQGVDVRARAEIYHLIDTAAASGSAVLMVSSDFEELAAVCDRVAALWRGSLVDVIEGAELTGQRLNKLAHAAVAA